VNQAIPAKLEHLANVVLQETKVTVVMLVHKVILVTSVQLVLQVEMVSMVMQALKETKVNQLVLQQYKVCQEKKEHQVFPV